MDAREEFAGARALAMSYIEHAPRTTAEVRRRLQRAGFDETVVEVVLNDLTASGVLDDRAFAMAWVESRSRARKLGAVRLESELRRKGIPTEIIAEALSALPEERSRETALELARAFLGSADPDDPAVRRRLAGYLLRRGHAWDTIEEVFALLRAK